jgi:hypothetical protein
MVRQTISRHIEKRWPRWQILGFYGEHRGESRGIVDLIAIRKDHRRPRLKGTRRGDAFQIIFIQGKGGEAERPSEDDIRRLRLIASHYHAEAVLLGVWKKGKEAEFFLLGRLGTWQRIAKLSTIFG